MTIEERLPPTPDNDDEIRYLYYNMDAGQILKGKNAEETLITYMAPDGQTRALQCKEGVVVAASKKPFSFKSLYDIVVKVLEWEPIVDNEGE